MFAGQFDARPHNSKLFRDLEKGSASQMQPEQAQTAASILTGPRRVVTINGASSTPPNIRPRRLAWPRTSPFHGGNTGSNPVGDANKTSVAYAVHHLPHTIHQQSVMRFKVFGFGAVAQTVRIQAKS